MARFVISFLYAFHRRCYIGIAWVWPGGASAQGIFSRESTGERISKRLDSGRDLPVLNRNKKHRGAPWWRGKPKRKEKNRSAVFETALTNGSDVTTPPWAVGKHDNPSTGMKKKTWGPGNNLDHHHYHTLVKHASFTHGGRRDWGSFI